MAAEAHAPTAGEYIVHHLTHLQTAKPKGLVDLSVLNFDSIVFSVLIGMLGCFLLWKAARTATSGVPGRFQAAVEILFEMVESQAILRWHRRLASLRICDTRLNTPETGSVVGGSLADTHPRRRWPLVVSEHDALR